MAGANRAPSLLLLSSLLLAPFRQAGALAARRPIYHMLPYGTGHNTDRLRASSARHGETGSLQLSAFGRLAHATHAGFLGCGVVQGLREAMRPATEARLGTGAQAMRAASWSVGSRPCGVR